MTRILEEGARLVEETVNPDAGGFVTAVLAGKTSHPYSNQGEENRYALTYSFFVKVLREAERASWPLK